MRDLGIVIFQGMKQRKKQVTKYLRLFAKSALDPSNWIKNYALSHIMSSKTGNLTNSSLSHGRTTKRPPPRATALENTSTMAFCHCPYCRKAAAFTIYAGWRFRDLGYYSCQRHQTYYTTTSFDDLSTSLRLRTSFFWE